MMNIIKSQNVRAKKALRKLFDPSSSFIGEATEAWRGEEK